jgi:transcriptional regulator with XRE-family HTH domain
MVIRLPPCVVGGLGPAGHPAYGPDPEAVFAIRSRAFGVNLENGKNNISLDKIFALADALGVDVVELFRGLDF